MGTSRNLYCTKYVLVVCTVVLYDSVQDVQDYCTNYYCATLYVCTVTRPSFSSHGHGFSGGRDNNEARSVPLFCRSLDQDKEASPAQAVPYSNHNHNHNHAMLRSKYSTEYYSTYANDNIAPSWISDRAPPLIATIYRYQQVSLGCQTTRQTSDRS